MTDHSDELLEAISQLAIADNASQEEAVQEVARIAADESADGRQFAIRRIADISDDYTQAQAEDLIEDHRVDATTGTIEWRRIEKILPAISSEEARYRFFVTAQSPVHGTVHGVIDVGTDDLFTPRAFETQLTEMTDQVMFLGDREEFTEYINRVMLDTPMDIQESLGLSREHELVQDVFDAIDNLQITTDWEDFADSPEAFGYYDAGDARLLLSSDMIRSLTRKVDGDVNLERAHYLLRDPWLAGRADNISKRGIVVRCWQFDVGAIADCPGIDIEDRADRDVEDYDPVLTDDDESGGVELDDDSDFGL